MEEQIIGRQEISLSSKKKWFLIGLVIAILNPIFSGLILGIAFWTESQLKKEGKIITAIAVIWGLLAMLLSRWLAQQGLLSV